MKYKDDANTATLNWWFKKLEGNRIKIIGIPVYITEVRFIVLALSSLSITNYTGIM